jgi:hypothetical protein
MDETACEPSDGFAAVAAACSALVERLVGFRPQ